MGKLEEIRRILSYEPDLKWTESSTEREHLRHKETYYILTGFQVAPQKQILKSTDLQKFSEKLTEKLVPLKPSNISVCYEYAETMYDVIKTAAIYFTDDPDSSGMERRIVVSIYPCEVMAGDLGVRATINLRHYNCPSPCEHQNECGFIAVGEGFWYEQGRR